MLGSLSEAVVLDMGTLAVNGLKRKGFKFSLIAYAILRLLCGLSFMETLWEMYCPLTSVTMKSILDALGSGYDINGFKIIPPKKN